MTPRAMKPTFGCASAFAEGEVRLASASWRIVLGFSAHLIGQRQVSSFPVLDASA